MPSCQQRPADFPFPTARARDVRVFPYLWDRRRLGGVSYTVYNQRSFKSLCRRQVKGSGFLGVFRRATVFPQGVRILALPAGLIHRLSTLTRVVVGAAYAA